MSLNSLNRTVSNFRPEEDGMPVLKSRIDDSMHGNIRVAGAGRYLGNVHYKLTVADG